MNYKAYILKNIPEASTGSRRRLDFPTVCGAGDDVSDRAKGWTVSD